MLRFFRGIRRKLWSEGKPEWTAGKFRKYFLYAIGEISLVVIGIFIALQINNANENHKSRRLEKSTLIELHNSLLADLQNFNDQIKIQSQVAEVSKELLYHLREKKPYTPRLDTMWEKAIRYYLFQFNNSAFKLLESRGIDLIRNQELRNEIVNHYNFEQISMQSKSDIQKHQSDQFISYYFDRLYPPISDNFEDSYNYKSEVLVPADYQNILDDPRMIAEISHSIKGRYRLSQLIQLHMEKVSVLSSAIEEEIQKFN